MLVPIRWLKEYTPVDMPVEAWVDGMVLSGTNLETIDYWDKDIDKVVVGKILSIDQHPDADKLVVCQVDCGNSPVQIVTGANNMKVGDKVAVALDGSTVPGPLHGQPKVPGGVKITAGKLRGVQSNGMMCGCGELGFPDKIVPMRDKEGLWLLDDECFVPGTPIVEALGIDLPTVDFEITPNRPDCLSMIGIARESAATFGTSFAYPETQCKNVAKEKSADYIQVEIKKPELCKRYCCRVIKDIKIEQSPWWMQQRLMLAGMRPINNIVDITNYVMLEYGQPLHAFDIRTVKGGKIVVDTAKTGEKFTTLDGVERTLSENILMINDTERPLAIAGIMGGLESEIAADTNMVLVESANFDGDSIRKSSKELNHRTEASGRFEKGIDPNLAKDACDRFCYLVEMLGAGTVLDGDVDVYPTPAKAVTLQVRVSRINHVLGIEIPGSQMVDYFKSLEMQASLDGDIITVTPPTVRQDLFIEEDYVEEVARMYGYDKLPVTIPKTNDTAKISDVQNLRNVAKDALIGMGYDEFQTYSFVSPKAVDKIRIPEDSEKRKFVKLINPLGEETSVMRTTILPNMLEVLSTNYNRKNGPVKGFELGNTFINNGKGDQGILPEEKDKLCIACYGEEESFYTIKGTVVELLKLLGVKDLEFVANENNTSFHPGRCADILKDGKVIGDLGEIHPEVASVYGIDTRVYAAEIDFALIEEIASIEHRYTPLPKYPAMVRDFSMVVKEEITVAELEAEIKKHTAELLESVTLFDVYRGAPILPGFKSVAFSLVYRRADRTLKEEEVNDLNSKMLIALKDEYDAVLREM
ncbi:MAG: phenylalanine--tRNA ligase subunit beta [Bacillota bacterium]|nr:phenylalanine--tRNA ligase subunit beta [Bacillota bacterium]